MFEAGAELIGSYRCALTIAAAQLTLAAGGPLAAYVPAAARSYAAPVAAAGAVRAGAAVVASPAHWLDTLEQQLQAGLGVRQSVTKWLTDGLSEDKLRAAMQQPDYQQTFIRLTLADKGFYQQRVVLDDYAAIPGVSQQ